MQLLFGEGSSHSLSLCPLPFFPPTLFSLFASLSTSLSPYPVPLSLSVTVRLSLMLQLREAPNTSNP